jgi:hypothetical protein
MVTKKTWPYGTQLAVEVIDVLVAHTRRGDARMVTCACDDAAYAAQAFLLLLGGDERYPAVGSRVTIEVRPGGPLGGHWAFL